MSNSQELSEVFNQARPENFGSAKITRKEISTLRNLYSITRNQVFGSSSQLRKEDKAIIRGIVTDSIIHQGWPNPKEVDIGDLGEAAISHACVVAEHLFETRGEEATPETFFSYTTKNQFDRFTKMILLRSGRIKPGGDLLDDWNKPQDREQGFTNPNVKFPEGLDNSKIYGIAKPNRYWPAQLHKTLEAIRLGKLTPEDRLKLKIGDLDNKLFSIPWSNYEQTIIDAKSIDDLAIGVATKTIEKLANQGIGIDTIVEIIIAGYNPAGIISEHGKIPQVGIIWKGILEKLKQNPNLINIHQHLDQRIREKMKEANYDFE